MMNLLSIAVLAQLAAPAQQTLPVLAFPEPGLDDSVAYQGYQTRFFRDAAGNTVQIYQRAGRLVHLWANADNESLALTVRSASGEAAPLRWGAGAANVSATSGTRSLEHEVVAEVPHIHLGWFLLGSMRVERDFQHAGRDTAPFAGAPFSLPEIDRLLAALQQLDPAQRRRHLAILGAPDMEALRGRLQPRISTRDDDTSWVTRVVQPSLDGRDSLSLELLVDPRQVMAVRAGDSISLQARSGSSVTFRVRITTGAGALTPLAREEIFTPEFLAFLAAARAAGDRAGAHDTTVLRAKWLERQVRGVELLVSREKLMAGLPNYATYFGRDVLVTALMMRPIWRNAMSEFAIASVLRKLSSSGQVSHEEAMGGQAVREAAAEYASLIEAHRAATSAGNAAAADSLLTAAGAVLGSLRRVRENYHMIDDEFQLPVLVARWLIDPGVSAERKRTFLLDTADGGAPRLTGLLRELALVSRLTAPYAADPVAANLVSFPRRDTGWASTSWRDSNAGYAAGRFAMDVNAIWVPHALESIGRIMGVLRSLGFSMDSLARAMPAEMDGTPLGGYARDSLALGQAIETWWSASRHFTVVLSAGEVRTRAAARLAAMPDEERAYWRSVLETPETVPDSLVFLDVALDAQGRPIGVANSDPATRLFLGDGARDTMARQVSGADAVMRDVSLFVRPYPVGLFIDRVGPVVANDAYAPPAVWRAFEADPYHGPRVVWGRDVNLFLLGVASRLEGEGGRMRGESAAQLREALTRVLAAVEASGFQSELWSYEIQAGRPVPVRYGTSSDVQLWSTTDLAVQFALSKLFR